MSALLGRFKHAAAADNKKLKYQALRELFIDIQYCREDQPKSGLPNDDLKFVDLFNDIRRQIRIIMQQTCWLIDKSTNLSFILSFIFSDSLRAYQASDNSEINLIILIFFLAPIKTPTLNKQKPKNICKFLAQNFLSANFNSIIKTSENVECSTESGPELNLQGLKSWKVSDLNDNEHEYGD